VPSHLNPVDAATRDSSMDIILSAINVWFKGPEYILRDNELLDEALVPDESPYHFLVQSVESHLNPRLTVHCHAIYTPVL
jgi:hypothetical protein